LPFDAGFTDGLAKPGKNHKILFVLRLSPMITWADNLTKCCIILLNYAKYTVYLQPIIVKFTVFLRKFLIKIFTYCRNQIYSSIGIK
jgi:hypothetical protein